MLTTISKKPKDTICLTISEGLWRSISRLWILISYLSQVLEPSPQGVLRVVIFRYLVGIRTGPLTFSFLSLAPRIRSAHTKEWNRNRVRLISIFKTSWHPMQVTRYFKHRKKINYGCYKFTILYPRHADFQKDFRASTPCKRE